MSRSRFVLCANFARSSPFIYPSFVVGVVCVFLCKVIESRKKIMNKSPLIFRARSILLRGRRVEQNYIIQYSTHSQREKCI